MFKYLLEAQVKMVKRNEGSVLRWANITFGKSRTGLNFYTDDKLDEF